MEYVGKNKKQLKINFLGFTVVLLALYLLSSWQVGDFWTGFLEAIIVILLTAIGISLWAYFAYPIYKIRTKGNRESMQKAILKYQPFFMKLKRESDEKWFIESNLLFGDVSIDFLEEGAVELKGPKNLLKKVRQQCGI